MMSNLDGIGRSGARELPNDPETSTSSARDIMSSPAAFERMLSGPMVEKPDTIGVLARPSEHGADTSTPGSMVEKPDTIGVLARPTEEGAGASTSPGASGALGNVLTSSASTFGPALGAGLQDIPPGGSGGGGQTSVSMPPPSPDTGPVTIS